MNKVWESIFRGLWCLFFVGLWALVIVVTMWQLVGLIAVGLYGRGY